MVKTLDQLAILHRTDKASVCNNGLSAKDYAWHYDMLFSSFRNEPIKLLEIGVKNGASLRMWKDYFPNAQIHGIDIDPHCKKHEEERIMVHWLDQRNVSGLRQLHNDFGPFDVVIDDGSHILEDQAASFAVLFNARKYYAIEDLHTHFKKGKCSMSGQFRVLESIALHGNHPVNLQCASVYMAPSLVVIGN